MPRHRLSFKRREYLAGGQPAAPPVTERQPVFVCQLPGFYKQIPTLAFFEY